MRFMFHIVVSLVVSVGLSGCSYFFDGEVPATASFVIDMDKVRDLAAAPAGELPLHVAVAKVSENIVPAGILVAGDGLGDAVMSRYTFQIVYPNGHVVLDTGMTLEQSTIFDRGTYYSEAFEQAMTAMETADLIIATHEHIDHIGALAVHPNLREIAPNALVTREQLAWAEELQGVIFPDWFVAEYVPLEFDDYYLAAPGLVLIKSAGHTPGSLMAYVSFADGSETLFVGDIVFTMAGLLRETARPKFVSQFIIEEDRPMVLEQMRALINLHEREPELRFIVAHDGAQIDGYIAEGWMKRLSTP